MTSSNQHPRSALLKAVSTGTATLKKELPCFFGRLEGKTLTLEFEVRPSISGPVSVEFNDAMFLGEVVRVAPATNGGWRCEIRVEQVLTGLQNLLHFRASLLGEGAGARVERNTPTAICA